MNAIETHALTRRFGAHTAVDGLDLTVRQGELFALLGVNGAGKTTTLRMLSGLLQPTGGEADILGFRLTQQPQEIKRRINLSPQETAVAPNLTVRENLELIAGIYGASRREAAQRAAELLKAAGVQSAILSLGGSVTALGARPDGSDWQVGLQDPQDAAACFGILRLQDRSVVTSGGYQRYFEQDGVRYSHILDPETLRCAESGLLSATAVCSDGTLADALSTALYVLGLEDGIALWRQGGLDFEAVWMTDAREIYVTAGLAAAFQSELPFEVVSR